MAIKYVDGDVKKNDDAVDVSRNHNDDVEKKTTQI